MSEKQRMTAAPVSEKQAEKAIRELFELYGWEVLKTEEDRFRGIQGLPDLLCTSPRGLQIWIEVKRPPSSHNPQGRVRKAQKERLIEWRRRGVPCCVADGVDALIREIAQEYPGDTDAALGCCDELCAAFPWWPA